MPDPLTNEERKMLRGLSDPENIKACGLEDQIHLKPEMVHRAVLHLDDALERLITAEELTRTHGESADGAARELRELRAERLLLARLAKCQDSPQFFNPLEAAAAMTLRDRVLSEAVSASAPAGGKD